MSSECVFCAIVAGSIPAKLLYEDAACVCFADRNAQAPTHLLIVPREHLASLAEADGHEALLGHLLATAAALARRERLERGYRMVVNTGDDGGQTVDHLHLHLLGGRPMGWPPG